MLPPVMATLIAALKYLANTFCATRVVVVEAVGVTTSWRYH
jgi:hypothetical protein